MKVGDYVKHTRHSVCGWVTWINGDETDISVFPDGDEGALAGYFGHRFFASYWLPCDAPHMDTKEASDYYHALQEYTP